ncbi:MAG: hypothetical protein KBC81_00365 [Candidatus Pacebacteria bacterium]|nr:hypothetical protein [Candidatus Paceibacterota bacterium]
MPDITNRNQTIREKAEIGKVNTVVQSAKRIRRGDTAVFDPATSCFELWGTRDGEVALFLVVKCSWIKNQTHFKDLVDLMGFNADPPRKCTIKDQTIPREYWAYKYL